MSLLEHILLVWHIAVTVFTLMLWAYVLKIKQWQQEDHVDAISELSELRERVDAAKAGMRFDLAKISDRINDQAERSDDIETCSFERVDAAKAEAARALNAVRDLQMQLPEIAQLVPKVNETRGWVTRFYREMKQDRYDLEKFQSDLEEWKVNNKTAFDDRHNSLKMSMTRHRKQVQAEIDSVSARVTEMLCDADVIAERLRRLEQVTHDPHTETESNRAGDTPDTPAD